VVAVSLVVAYGFFGGSLWQNLSERLGWGFEHHL
jgi:hypothetical protein